MGKVHMMKLAAMEQYKEGPLTGHRFKIAIDVTDPMDCTLSWYERTDQRTLTPNTGTPASGMTSLSMQTSPMCSFHGRIMKPARAAM